MRQSWLATRGTQNQFGFVVRFFWINEVSRIGSGGGVPEVAGPGEKEQSELEHLGTSNSSTEEGGE
jgi:hypothetical protein